MPTIIRAAMPQDAQTIAEIIQKAFHEDANPEQIQRRIASEQHYSYVAEAENVLGFVDGFVTIAQDGTKRLELDLLAVHPEFSGRGIGKQLIKAFSENMYEADMIRALIAVENTPMHRAMQATGYQLAQQIYALYIGSDGGEAIDNPPASHLIPVETFTYSGIWLEGDISENAIAAAQYQSQKRGFDIVGTVIPTQNTQAIETLQNAGFEYIKHYQWWLK